MNSKIRRYALLLAILLPGIHSSAQVSGTITVPSTTYPDLASVISALNSQGTAGSVTVNITSGNPQTAPAGGYVLGSAILNPTVTASKSITINGNGNTITSFTGTDLNTDGIFKILGTDYVVIDSLNLLESAANTTQLTQMEWGYALLKLNGTTPYDGCQNITISHCHIALGTAGVASTAIYANNHTATSITPLSATGTIATDAASNNSFYGNTITSCNRGIYLSGINSSLTYDYNNTIGIPSGNNISFIGSAATGYGVATTFDSVVSIKNNTINTAAANANPAYAIYLSTGKGNATVSGNNISMQSAGTTQTLAGIYNAAHADATTGATLSITNNVLNNWSYPTMTTANLYGIFHAASLIMDTVNIKNNTVSNITGGASGVSGSLGGFPPITAAYDMIYSANGGSLNVNITNNTVSAINLSNSGVQTFCVYASGSGLGTVNVSKNVVTNITSGASILGVEAVASSTKTAFLNNNRVQNLTSNSTTGSGGQIFGVYAVGAGGNSEIANDTVSNITSISTCYGINSSFVTPIIHHNFVSNLTNTGATNLYGIYNGGGTPQIYNNKINNLSLAGTSGAASGINFSSNTDTALVYNNIVSDFSLSSGFVNAGLADAIIGINLSGGRYKVYHNTVKITAGSNGINVGASGIYYSSSSTYTDLRNNIINVNVTPAGTGYTMAIRRNSGTAGTAPANLAMSCGGNIYYVPNAPNCLYYGEGITTVVNKFSPINDPNFNSSCGAYKTFMGRDLTSYTENNLVAGPVPNSYIPTGASFAKNGGIPTGLTQLATDYAGSTRPATAPDAGSLQFSGTSIDIAPPVITYGTLPATTYCTTAPVLTANITDATGVNITTGTAPRMYYKKATENNAFGNYPADNTSAFNGWKYVEATGTAPNFSFTIDYSKLATAAAVNDSISYFVMAQDVTPAIQVGVNNVSFASGFCASSVNLTPAAGPLNATPAAKGYKITAPASFTATATQTLFCTSGSTTMLGVTPVPTGLTVQWQQDNGTGTYADIAGATTNPYTATVTGTNNYQAILKCNGSAVATTTAIAVSVTNPQVTATTAATRCGAGTLALGATGSANTTLNWYNAASGGTLMGTGSTFTTPAISATTTYYVAASSNVAETVPAPASLGNYPFWTLSAGWGLVFTVNNPVTINSVKMYPANSTTSGAATLAITISDMSNNILYTGPVYNFTVSGTASVQTVPVGIALPPGNYKMGMTSTGINQLYTEFNATYPYTPPSNSISITAGATGGTTTNSEYYWFYAWSVTPGCISGRTPVVATVTTAPAISLHASTTNLCLGSNDTLTCTSANSGYTYTWTPGALTGSPVIVSPTLDTTYKVVATDNSGGVNNGCVISDSVAIHVNPVPTATITPSGNASICAGDSITLTAMFGFGYTYQWLFNNTSISGAAAQTYAANNSGSYKVQVTQGPCATTSAPVNITVNPLPTPTITANGAQLQTGSFTSYQWNMNGTPISGATNAIYTPTQSGSYTVTVTNSNGCSATAAAYTYGVGIGNVNPLAASVKIYPNPASTIVYVTAPVKVNIVITDLLGKVLLKQQDAKYIDLQAFAAGVYLIQVRDSDDNFIKIDKLVKKD